MTIHSSLSHAFVKENTSINLDGSTTSQVTNSSLVDARRYTTVVSDSPRLSPRDSIRSLRTRDVDRTREAANEAKKRAPRISIGQEDTLRYLDAILDQTLGYLELLQKLECDPKVYNKLEAEFELQVGLYEELIGSKPKGWAKHLNFKYLSQLSALKASSKDTLQQCITASQATRKINVKLRNLERLQRQIKSSPRRGSEWTLVLESIRDEEDEPEDELGDLLSACAQ